jgi:cytidylate kinase
MELAGLAGSGKTTISKFLCGYGGHFALAPDIELRKAAHLPFFFKHIRSWLPFYLHRESTDRELNWSELKYITYLKEWSAMMRRQPAHKGKVLLLDHGPVFRLATLREFGPAKLKSPAFRDWWDRLYRQWAHGLDVIVWLDAPDETLADRINARGQRHSMKGRPRTEAADFLMRYRMSYLYTLERLMHFRQPALLQFDTSAVPVENIVEEILAECRS